MASIQNNNYASFWSRFAAFIVDLFVLILFLALFNLINSNQIVNLFVELIFLICYNTLLLSSKWQATIGMFLTGLKAYDKNNNRLTLWQALLRTFVSSISYILVLPFLMIFFTKKRQALHDVIAKTVIIDHNAKYNFKTKSTPKMAKTSKGFKYFIIIFGVILFGYIAFLTLPTVIVYGILIMKKAGAHDYSFRVHYDTNDYNDSNILFYKEELKNNIPKFVEADSLYGRFEYDTKIELAEECIDYFSTIDEGEKSIYSGYNFYKNARNKYTNTESLIEKAKKNEKLMGRHFYTYDLNIVRHVIEDIVSYPKSKKGSQCTSLQSVDVLYKTFLGQYIYEYYSESMYNQYRSSPPQQRQIDWYNELIERFPYLLNTIKEKKNSLVLEAKKRKEEWQQEETLRKKERQEEVKSNAKEYLYSAVTSQNNSQDLLLELKKAKVDFDMLFEKNRTALILAVINEKEEVINFLLDAGANIKIKDEYDKIALDYLDSSKHRKTYIRFKMRRALDNAPKFEGERESYSISYDKKSEKMVVKQYGINRKTWSPLIVAIESNNLDEIKKLIDNGEYLEQRTNNENTPLMAAILTKNNFALDKLLDKNVNIEAKNTSGLTPLYLSVIENNIYATKRLISLGADMYAMDNNMMYNPFLQAVEGANTVIVNLFIKNGVNINYQYKKSETALTLAGKGCRNYEVFKLLFESGADPDIKDEYGFTTRTGLRRYCSKNSDYIRFQALMDN